MYTKQNKVGKIGLGVLHVILTVSRSEMYEVDLVTLLLIYGDEQGRG